MDLCRTIATCRAAVARFRAEGARVGLVTTMGALHAGHMALIEAAKAGSDRVVATIFVNPTQFGDPADLDAYPRMEADDLAKLKAAGVHTVFIPDVKEIYPIGDETIVETTRLAGLYHGAVRPGHFRGVATVVARLFNIVQADAAWFGEKDYQQLAVIRRMGRDLHFPIEINGVPTVREADGLALSSRNARLTPEDRAAAPVLHRALQAAATAAREGATAEALDRIVRDTLAAEPRAVLAGLDIVEPEGFARASGPLTGPVAIMLSATFGDVLLLDQKEIQP